MQPWKETWHPLKMYTLFSVLYVSTVLVIGTIDNYLQQLFTQKVMKRNSV